MEHVTIIFGSTGNSYRKEWLALRREIGNVTREFRRFGSEIDRTRQAVSRTFRAMKREVERVQRDLHHIRRELTQLGQTKVQMRITLDDKTSAQIDNIWRKLLDRGRQVMHLATGTTFAQGYDELQAASQERALYAARGKTAEEMQTFDREAKELLQVNPTLTLAEAMRVLAKSEQYNGANAKEYAEVAMKLGLTTRYAPEDHLRLLAAMRERTGVDDAKRLGDALQYMSNGLPDLHGSFADAIMEYTEYASRFLQTPEQIATLVTEIGRMGIWADDKARAALREVTRTLSDQGAFTNVLQAGYEAQGLTAAEAEEKAAQEAAELNRLLHSGNEADNRAAMGRVMLSLAALPDQVVRQQVLSQMVSSTGKDLIPYLAPIMELGGKISTGEIRPNIGGHLDKAYQSAVANNPFIELQKAQNEAKLAALDLAAKIVKDVTPALEQLSHVTGWVIEKFNTLSDGGRVAAEIGLAAAEVLAPVLLKIWLAKKAGDSKQRGSGSCCCCCFGNGGPAVDVGGRRSKGKPKNQKKWWNPRTWFGGGGDRSAPSYGMEKQRLEKNAASKGRWGWLEKINPFRWKKEGKGKDLIERVFDGLEGLGSYGRNLARKIPGIGVLLAAEEILTADNKLDAAGRVGTEALFGWGGAAMGAAIGSIIPGVGTVAGGILGGILGASGGGAIFDKVKSWWSGAPVESAEENIYAQNAKPPGVGVPTVSPAKPEEKPKLATLTIQNMSITLRADGVLQDIPTMVRMLNSPEVKQTINRNVEQAIIDAIETRGGVAG